MFKRILYTLSVLAGVLLYTSCGTNKKVNALKPNPDYLSTTVVYEKQLSFINMPMEITMNEIQAQTNQYLSGIIYEDKNINDDNVMMKVTKEAPIRVTEQNGKVFIDFPLRINGKFRYGFDKFGMSMYDTRDFYLNGTIKLVSLISFKDWKMTTRTAIVDIVWKESPSVNIAGKNVPVTYAINSAIGLFKSYISKKVDDAIAESLDIEPYVLEALDAVSNPVKINEEYNTWFAFQPQEAYTTRAVIANKKVTIGLGVKAYLETAIGKKPEKSFDKNALALKAIDKIPNQFKVNVAAYATYADASAIVQKNFAGERFESGKKYVVVNHVELWGKENKMIVALNMSGSVNGTFYLSGIPKYNMTTKEVYLDEVDFVMDSKNKLLKTADWLAHGMILKKITENCKFSIADQLAEGEQSMKGYLNGYEPVKGVKVNGVLTSLQPHKVILTPNAIVAMILANGKVSVKIEGM